MLVACRWMRPDNSYAILTSPKQRINYPFFTLLYQHYMEPVVGDRLRKRVFARSNSRPTKISFPVGPRGLA